jgi:hypothetical protein
MGHQGLNDGELSEQVLLTKHEHSQALLDTEPYWYHTPEFCELKNQLALKQERTRILNYATLRYSDYFDHDGRFIGKLIDNTQGVKNFAERQNKAIQQAISLDITHITPSDLITESAKPNDPLARGRSKQKYLVESNVKDVVTKVATGLFGGIYTAQFIGADTGEIAYRVVIAIILLAFGVVKYYSNYRFVVGEHRERIIVATHWLKEFKTLYEQGKFNKATE